MSLLSGPARNGVAKDAVAGWRGRAGLGLLLLAVTIAVLPLAWRGPSCGQDSDFHLQNWLETARSMRQGVVYPHWAASANYGAGEPRFIFYPPVSRFLGAALGGVLPWGWVQAAFVFLALLGAGWSMRALVREQSAEQRAQRAEHRAQSRGRGSQGAERVAQGAKNEAQSTAHRAQSAERGAQGIGAAEIAACLYVVNPYMLFVAYERGAMAELLAAVWFPLLVLYGLRRRPAVVPLALTVAAVWLTNAPAGTMGCYLLAVVVATAAVREKSWRLVRRALAAVPLGLGLAGFWLVPAIYEQRWVEIGRAIGPLMRVEDSFIFGYVKVLGRWDSSAEVFDTLYHNQVLRMASWIVVALLAGTLAAGVASWARMRREEGGFGKGSLEGGENEDAGGIPTGSGGWAWWWPLVMAGILAAALQFRWSDVVWRHTPELQYLQFPWRWMLVLGMIFAALTGMAAGAGMGKRMAAPVWAVVVLAFAGGMAALASAHFWQPCDEEDNAAAQIATFQTKGFPGTDEYTPKPAEMGAAASGLPAVRVLTNADGEEEGENSEWTPEPEQEIAATVRTEQWKAEEMRALVMSPRPGYAVLRLMDYPAWKVERNGVVLTVRPRRTDGLMAIPVGAGANEIEVRWSTTDDVKAGFALTLWALAVTLALILNGRRRRDGRSFR